MISLYTSAVLTTAVIAGMAIYAVQESERKPAVAMDGMMLSQAHDFAVKRGAFDRSAIPSSDEVLPMNMGPFYSNGRAKSFLILDTEVVDGKNTVTKYVLTSLAPNSTDSSNRAAGAFRKDEQTSVGIVNEDGVVPNMTLPAVDISMEPGSVVAITKIGV